MLLKLPPEFYVSKKVYSGKSLPSFIKGMKDS